LRADLQAANLLLPSLWKPGNHCASGIGLYELLSNPEAFCRRLGLNPDQVALVDAFMRQTRQMRVFWGADHNNLTTVCHYGH